MKKLSTYIVLIALLLNACKKEEPKIETLNLGDFTLSTSKLVSNKPIEITYNENSNELEALYFYMVNNKSYPVDINFSESNKATITIPDSAQAVAFNFKINGKYDDNNKKGYLNPLHNNDGKEIIGSKAALANYAMTYGKEYGIEIEKTDLFNDIKEDITNHPELNEAWNLSFLNLAYRNNKTEGEKLINEYIATQSLKTNLSEKDYMSLMKMYRTINKTSLSDSIKKITTDKFPNGETAKSSLVSMFSEEKDLAKKELIFNQYNEKYKIFDRYKSYMTRTIAMEHYKNKNLDQFNEYAKKIDDESSKAGLYNSVAWPLAEKGEDLDFAAKTSKSSLDLMQSLKSSLKNKPDYSTANQYKRNLENSYNMYADTYALILFKQGKVKEAISYQKKAIGKGLDGDLNERYIEFLIADKQYKVAQNKSEEFIKEGHSSPKINEYYKTAYINNNPDNTDFDVQLEKLETEAHNNYTAEIKEKLLNDKAPDFTLKDLEGKEVSLTSLKGKIVILDFWATWCGPCKASFPGMQEVVTKYKDDDSVKLLFIDTFENGDKREQQVSDFIQKNKYTFHVLLDKSEENSRDFEVAGKYNVSGIPTKIIIGKDGNIKFKAVGYSGQTKKLVDELDIMIEILK